MVYFKLSMNLGFFQWFIVMSTIDEVENTVFLSDF